MVIKKAYSVEEVAEITTLSEGFLRADIKAERLKVKRFGRRILILKDDLEKYLEKGSES